MKNRSAIQSAVLALAFAVSGPNVAQVAEPNAVTLMQEHKCYMCHANDEELAGPAFADVAMRYRGDPRAVDVIASHVRHGVHSDGPWHMPPHPEVSTTEATTIAQYILSLDQRWIDAPAAAPHERLQPATTTSPRP